MSTIKTKNKLLATMIITLLFASMVLAVVPLANATADISRNTGRRGDIIHVTGDDDVTSGDEISAYLGTASVIDSSSVLIGSATTNSADEYDITATIPSTTTSGSYSIVVYNEDATDVLDVISFIVLGDTELSVDEGCVGTTVTVSGQVYNPVPATTLKVYVGSGNTVATAVEITPIMVSAWMGNDFTLTFDVPKVPAGTYNVFVEESDAGTVVYTEILSFTVNPQIELVPDEGELDADVVVNGNGFAANQVVTFDINGTAVDSDPEEVTTDADGTFTATIKIPATMDKYNITATDALGNASSAIYTTTVTVIINQNIPEQQQGPSGSTIQVDGYGFTPNNWADIYFVGVSTSDNIKVLSDVPLDATGAFSVSVIVPTVSEPEAYAVYVVDKVGKAYAKAFEVTETTSIAIDEEFYAPGGAVEVTGEYFAANIQGAQVTLTLTSVADGQKYGEDQTFNVAADGTFAVTFQLPNVIPTGQYVLTANDKNGLYATELLWIVNTIVTVDPNVNVVTGTFVKVNGYNFDVPDTNYLATIYFGDIEIPGQYTHAQLTDPNNDVQVLVPSVPVGPCVVKIVTDNGLTGQTTITIAKTTTLEVDPVDTLRDADVDIKGTYFTANLGTIVNITLVDEADNIVTAQVFDGITNQDVVDGHYYFQTSTDANGAFTVLNVHILPTAKLGSYTVVAIDANGLAANATLNVVQLDVDISTTAPWYFQGEQGAFYIFATAKTIGNITILDSNGLPYAIVRITDLDGWSQMTTGEHAGKWVYMVSLTHFNLNHGAASTNTTDLPYTWTAVFDDAGNRAEFPVNEDGELEPGTFNVYTRPFVVETPDGPVTTGGGSTGGGSTGGGSSNSLSSGQKDEVANMIASSDLKGAKGDKGDKGDSGSSGSSGSSGATGATGQQGPAGAAGATGQQGPAGEDTSTGLARTAIIIAVVALIVGAIAAFIVVTLRRKIAN